MKFVRIISGMLLALGLVLSSTTAATAAPTFETVQKTQLATGSLGVSAGAKQLSTGGEVILVPNKPKPGVVKPNYSIGYGWGLYIYFNQSEQRMLVTGGSAVVGAALCAGGFGVTCAVASGLVAITSGWIGERGGICTGTKKRLELWIPSIAQPLANSLKCVK